MRIDRLTRRSTGDRTRIEARFVYENSYLPPINVFYEAGPPLADALEATPEAFVLPGLPIAIWEGERRLHVEGKLDAKLSEGLKRASTMLASWYDRCGNIELEPSEGFRETKPHPQRRTAALMSGGVDAMAMLAENRRRFPLDHPSSIRTVLYAFGFNLHDRPRGKESAFMRARHEAQARRLEALGKRVGFDVIRLDTNVRLLDPFWSPFYYAAYSGAFLAPLIASPSCVGDALIASAGEGGPIQTPHGSHPMLDIQYSTAAVQVHHMQPQVARTDKVRMIADWEPAFDTLQVCHGPKMHSPDASNCGRCEKCIRTMVSLLICNALPCFTTFPNDDVTPEMINNIRIKARYDYLTMPEVIEGLEAVGRSDLVGAIQTQVERLPVRMPPGPTGRWHRRLQNLRRRIA